MIKFEPYLRAKAGNVAYSFLIDVFTLPTIQKIDSYLTLDSNAEDRILYKTIDDCQRLLDNIISSRPEDTDKQKEWARMVILKFDERFVTTTVHMR